MKKREEKVTIDFKKINRSKKTIKTTKKLLLLGSLGFLSFILPLKVSAANFTKQYIFSDSTSDPGNIFNATTAANNLSPNQIPPGFPPPTPPSPPYDNGRFSNGFVWVEYIAQELGIELTRSTDLSVLFPGSDVFSPITQDPVSGQPIVSPFYNGATLTNSVNFAFGGAKTGLTGATDLGALIPGVKLQVDSFVNDLADQEIDENPLIILFAGGNDLRTFPDADPEVSVENLASSLTALYEKGARNFLVPNLRDFSEEPGITSNPNPPVPANDLVIKIDEFNLSLEETLNQLSESLNGITIVSPNFYNLFNDIRENPGTFGLTNLNEACFNTETLSICSNPNEYLYWDNTHWTTTVHGIVGDFALEAVKSQHKSVPESTPILSIVALGLLGTTSTLKCKLKPSK